MPNDTVTLNALNLEEIADKRPLDYVYALMSKQVYKGSKLQKGEILSSASDEYTKWKIEEVFYDVNSEYFGAIYVNRQDNWIVVAHRGTNTLKACIADLEEICLNKLTRQKQVVYELVGRAITLAKDKEFNLSFTGHSLGAFLAELSVFYCYSKFEFPYVHAVTFESPGSEESLKALESHLEAERVKFSELDVVGYVSYPNIINTCNHHIGSLYQVEPLLSDHSQYFSSWYQYTELAHSIDRIVKVFENGKMGRPLRLQYLHDWPMGNQRKKFFEIAKLNEDETYILRGKLLDQEQFILDCQAHHSFNRSLCTASVLPIKHFDSKFQKFLVLFQAWKINISNVKAKALLVESGVPDYITECLLDYHLNEKVATGMKLLCLSEGRDVVEFRRQLSWWLSQPKNTNILKKLLVSEPALIEVIASVVAPGGKLVKGALIDNPTVIGIDLWITQDTTPEYVSTVKDILNELVGKVDKVHSYYIAPGGIVDGTIIGGVVKGINFRDNKQYDVMKTSFPGHAMEPLNDNKKINENLEERHNNNEEISFKDDHTEETRFTGISTSGVSGHLIAHKGSSLSISATTEIYLDHLGPTLILKKLEESAGYHTLHIKNKFTEKLYVPPFSCAFDYDPRIIPVTDDSLSLLEADIFEFCKPETPQKILLLAGEAGTGKSLLGYHLQWSVWQEKTFPVPNAIFIFIDLPTIKDPIKNLIQEYFIHKFGPTANKVIDFLKQLSSLFFILDGFDEIASFRKNTEHLANLYQSNQLKEWKNAKFIINCRSSFLRNLRDYRRYFSPVESGKPCYDLLRTVQIALFNQKQINKYIEVYVRQRSQKDPSTWTITKYNEELEAISSLKSIIRTPLLLEMTMQALPIISEWHAAKKKDSPGLFLEVTERDVFLAYLKDNLKREDFKQVGVIYTNFKERCLDFLLNLCKVLLENHTRQAIWDNNKEGAGPVWAEPFFGRPKHLYDEEQLKFLGIIRSHLTCFLIYDKYKKVWSFVHDTFLDKFSSINMVELSKIQSQLIIEYKQKGYEKEEAISKARNDSITEFAEILFYSETGPYYFTGRKQERSVYSTDDVNSVKSTLFSQSSMEINSTPQGQFSDERQLQDHFDSQNKPSFLNHV